MKLSHCAAIGLAMVVLLMPLSATQAQLYRYKDANGNWSYTDNLADVPMDQREDCKQYESIETPAAAPKQTAPARTAEDQAAPVPEKADRLRSDLQARKAALDKEYDALVNESADLEKRSHTLKSEEDKRAFEIRKNTFNKRLQAFEEKRQVFEKDLRAYNDIVGYQKN